MDAIRVEDLIFSLNAQNGGEEAKDCEHWVTSGRRLREHGKPFQRYVRFLVSEKSWQRALAPQVNPILIML